MPSTKGVDNPQRELTADVLIAKDFCGFCLQMLDLFAKDVDLYFSRLSTTNTVAVDVLLIVTDIYIMFSNY